jgi:hypothetical protein
MERAMTIKTYLGTFLCLLSSSLIADTYENPFISKTEATVFGISATTGFIVPLSSQKMQIAHQRVQFYSQVNQSGVPLDIENRHNEYMPLKDANNVNGKAKSIEKIGDAGARQYARSMGFEPIYQGKPGQGKGFDQVYRSGKQIVVVEAKGGNSPLKQYYGYRQGTAKYTLEVANRTLKSPKATQAARKAAIEIRKAHKEGRLVIQKVRTKHIDGKAEPTFVRTTYGNLAVASPLKIAHQTGLNGGLAGIGIAGGFELLSQLNSDQKVNWQKVGGMVTLGGISVYSGTLTGTLIQHSLVSSQSKLLSTLAARKTATTLLSSVGGGLVGGVVFSYGAYLLGYGDFKTANRSMVSSIASYGAWALGGAALGGGAALTFATSIAGMIGATASTGTAIASLSGAAAANATLAWLGGGTLAAGGGGVAAGTTVLAGISATGVGLLAVGVGAGVMYLFHLSDEGTDQERVEHLLSNVQTHLNEPL